MIVLFKSKNTNPKNNQESPEPKNIESTQSLLKGFYKILKETTLDVIKAISHIWDSFSVRVRFLLSFTVAVMLFSACTNLLSNSLNNKFPNGSELTELTSKQTYIKMTEGWDKLVTPQRSLPFFTLVASYERKYGILPDEKLILKSNRSISLEFIKENLETSVPVIVEKTGDTTYEIRSQENIRLDKILNVKLKIKNKESDGNVFDRDYSWAFQTQGKFRVVSTIPGNEKTDVPLNTGIEIVFNQDDYENPENYISVYPPINFRIEIRGNTMSIIPQEGLQEKTLYTVTLKKGLNLKSRNDPIESDYTFSFQTREKQENRISFSFVNDFHQITPNDKFQAAVYTASWVNNKIKADVYIFKSPEDFIISREKIDKIRSSWMNYYSEKESVDTTNLSKVMSVDLDIIVSESLSYIELPDTLPRGFYLLVISYGNEGKTEQSWIQSTNLTGYISVGKEQTVIWANKSGGRSVRGAEVKLLGSNFSMETGGDGVAVFNTPRALFEGGEKYFSVSRDEDIIYLKVEDQETRYKRGETTSDDYWSYFYHERSLYKPTDKIDFFGVIKKRSSDSPPSRITVEMYNGYLWRDYYSDEQEERSAIFTKAITPNKDGSFIGSFSFEDLPKGNYYIKIIADKTEVVSNSFEILNYEKPEIDIEIIGDKKAIFADESVEFSIISKFYDNTPLANTPLSINESSSSNDSMEINTDEQGQIKYIYRSNFEIGHSYPKNEHIAVEPATPHEVNIEEHGSVLVFGSRVTINSESEQEGVRAKFTATVSEIDLSGINTGNTTEYTGDPVKNQEVEISLKKSWYEKNEDGTYYDFVEKITRKKYCYKHHSEIVETKTLKTNDGGKIEYKFDTEEGKWYELIATTKDKNDRPSKTSAYFYGSKYRRSTSEEQYPELKIGKETNKFSVGEKINVSINLGSEIYPDNDSNKFLFITAKNGLQEATVKDTPTYRFDFEKKFAPNFYLAAVIYTGNHYSRVSNSHQGFYGGYQSYYYLNSNNYFNGYNIFYDEKKNSSIDLNLDLSQSSNEPGGRGKILVKAIKNGEPVKNASVNLILVDQALEAIDGIIVPSILSTLYKSTPHYIYYNYGSHEPVLPEDGGAEMGGGGPQVREIFKDSGYFGLKKTDENGIVEFEFDLPDNITTWIVYAQAIDENLNAGWKEGKLSVTKSFFVTSQFPYQFLEKEKATVIGSSYGTALKEDDLINYRALFYKGENELNNSSKTGKAFRSVVFDIPQLDAGNYSAVLEGSTNGKKDGVKLPLTVLNSRFKLENYTNTILNKGDTQTSAGISNVLADEPITLIVSDAGKGIFYNYLKRHCYTSSNRLEKQLSGVVASSVLNSRFSEECRKTNEGIDLFQNPDGGLSQVRWGGSNLETTAWAVNINPEPFDKQALSNYFEETLKRSYIGIKDEILALWGLTKLGNPKIIELNFLRERVSDFEDKVILGIALASAGDLENARDIYYGVLTDYAYQSEPYIRIQNPKEDPETTFILGTSYALLLGEMTDEKYNSSLGKYISDFRGRAENLVTDLSEISYIQKQIDELPDEDTQIYFKSSNVERYENLTKGKSLTYHLSPNDINNFYLKVNEGKAETYINYHVNIDGYKELSQDDKLKIFRSIRKIKRNEEQIKTGDILEIKISFDLDHHASPPGKYIIKDYLPSGLKYISNPLIFGLKTQGWVEHEDQVITYSFYNSSWWRKHGQKDFVYYARAGSVGTYIAEPAMIQSQKELKNFNSTPENVVIINSSNN
ncbi:Ig-like domain-containing protein [Patescibacteria group bacterium]|nr:Ig-like domain-containing protein [Patescibacteria group bacterium]